MISKNVNQDLPAGLIDENVEFFAHGNEVHALYQGKKTNLKDLPDEILDILRDEMIRDKDAMKSLTEFGLTSDEEMIEQFVKCRFGGFDNQPDIIDGKTNETEYWDCGIRGKCPYEGKLCQAIKVENGYLTKREIEVIKLIASGYYDKEIAAKLHISPNTVPVHKENIKEKTGARSKVEIAVLAIQKNIIQ